MSIDPPLWVLAKKWRDLGGSAFTFQTECVDLASTLFDEKWKKYGDKDQERPPPWKIGREVQRELIFQMETGELEPSDADEEVDGGWENTPYF